MIAFLISAILTITSSRAAVIANQAQSVSSSDASQFYSEGQKTNAAQNTILAQTGTLSSGGVIGANYEVSILVTSSSTMTYRLETLDAQNNIVSTIYISAPANKTKAIEPRADFYIPNGYKLQVKNDSAGILGTTMQASIIMKVTNIIDK